MTRVDFYSSTQDKLETVRSLAEIGSALKAITGW